MRRPPRRGQKIGLTQGVRSGWPIFFPESGMTRGRRRITS